MKKKLATKLLISASQIKPTDKEESLFLFKEDTEDWFKVEGLGSEFCRRLWGIYTNKEIIKQMITWHNIPKSDAADFEEYICLLSDQLIQNNIAVVIS